VGRCLPFGQKPRAYPSALNEFAGREGERESKKTPIPPPLALGVTYFPTAISRVSS